MSAIYDLSPSTGFSFVGLVQTKKGIAPLEYLNDWEKRVAGRFT
jgi:hypothetical protein